MELCVDSDSVISIIQNGGGGNVMGHKIVQRIHQMLRLNWEVRLKYIYREENYCADGLANMAFNLSEGIVLFD
ncbi:putative non-LTR retroelement reverse transcriptase, partial [Trifolium medium]|nr:putative non-LTR retroelement reverse transcriptase [Trifolium medium]